MHSTEYIFNENLKLSVSRFHMFIICPLNVSISDIHTLQLNASVEIKICIVLV